MNRSHDHLSGHEPIDPSRRRLIQAMLVFPTAGLIGFTGSTTVRTLLSAGRLDTPAQRSACADEEDEPTPAQTEGPHFKPSSPERRTLVEPGLTGTPLTISGRVLLAACTPVAGARLDFWQADADGRYDDQGFRLRGHQYTDGNGRFLLTTIVPGLYPGRTRQLHVKVQAPDQLVLTTQWYFPGEPRNARDPLYAAPLLLDLRNAGTGKAGTFDIVLAARHRRDAALAV